MIAQYVESAALSDVGRKRKNNEDSCLELPGAGVFAVADGMGGVAGGDVASEEVVGRLRRTFEKSSPDELRTFPQRLEAFRRSINQSSQWIKGFADERAIGQMGSTVVAFLVDPENPRRTLALHAGDSRLYRFRSGQLELLTADHSAVAYMAAKLGCDPATLPARYQNELMRAVGLAGTVELEASRADPASHDLFLLCSDGLSKMLPDETIARHLQQGSGQPLPDLARALIESANAAGGQDNVTVVLVRFKNLDGLPEPEKLDGLPKAVAAEPKEDPPSRESSGEGPTQTYVRPEPGPPPPEEDDLSGHTPRTPETPGTTPLVPHSPVAEAGKAGPVEPAKPGRVGAARPSVRSAQRLRNVVVAIASLILLSTAGVLVGPSLLRRSELARNPGSGADGASAGGSNLVGRGGPTTGTTTTVVGPSAAERAYRLSMAAANSAIERGDWKEAESPIRQALDARPDDPDALVLLRRVQAAREELAASQEVRQKVGAAVRAAEAAAARQDWDAALVLLGQAQELSPGDSAVLRLLTTVKAGQAARDQALATEKEYQTLVKEGRDLLLRGDQVGALMVAEKAMKLKPGDSRAVVLREEAEARRKAEERYRGAIARAGAAVQQGSWSEAERAAREALEIRPDDVPAKDLLVKAHELRKVEEQKAAEAIQARVDGLLADARALLERKDFEGARRQVDEGLKLKPEDPQALALRDRVQRDQDQATLAARKAAKDAEVQGVKPGEPAGATASPNSPANSTASVTPAATTNPPTRQADEALIQATRDYEEMLVRFRVKKSDAPEITTPEGRNAKVLGSSITRKEFDQRSKRIDGIMAVFTERGLLEESDRKKNLETLRRSLRNAVL